MKNRHIDIPQEQIAEFCRRHRIRRLALFGSALRDDFTPDSDVDVLVEFEPGARVGMIRLAGIELELSAILGRKVDMNTPGFISKYFRDEVLAEAKDQYVAA
ncbi:MAG: nucleotidyltransferase family protein [Desulfobacterales bacterium]